MLAADFDRLAKEHLGALLASRGWQPSPKSVWIRPERDGEARLALDPSRQCDRFAVLLGWLPADMSALIGALFKDDRRPEGTGFLCGPYLTPGGVFRRPKHWRCRTRADLLASLDDVHRQLLAIGEPWLASLREPLVLAQQADPVAALVAGYAWERAGCPDRARPLYEEMWQRLEGAFALGPRSLVPASAKRQYLFLADRLGRNTPLAERLRNEPRG